MGSLEKRVGATCIVLVMVFSALVGFVIAQSGNVSVSPKVGTRGEVHEAVSLVTGETIQGIDDGNGNMIFPEVDIKDTSTPVAVADSSEPTELVVDGGRAVTQVLRKLELLESPNSQITYQSEHGTITVGTRAGEIDAGGPYGGPNCFEGSCKVHFKITVNDPTILQFRFDWEGDGVFDYPEQTSAGLLGDWVTTSEFDYTFYDNFYSDMIVEGWDGVSTYIVINIGDILGERTTWNLGMGMFGGTWRLVGNSFKAKKPITVTEIGYYQYPGRNVHKMYFWVFGGGPRLGMCEPAHINFQWNWCTVPTSFDLVTGEQYWLAVRIDGSFQGWTPPPAELNGEYLSYEGMWGSFCYDPTPDTCTESFNWGGTNYAAMVDFKFRETLILPSTVSDTAHLDVRNVAPDVFGIRTDPSPGLEGTPISFIAEFDDPGRDDTWEYRWTTPEGVTPWRTVDKLSGGANVLILHSVTGWEDAIRGEMETVCGSFCKSIDFLNYWAESRVPDLNELLPYDVVVMMSNYGVVPDWDATGDLLADFMDDAGSTGGGVVMMLNSFYSGSTWGVRGRWQNDLYAPIPLGGYTSAFWNLGPIYVPGHPIFDGVASVNGRFRGLQTSVNPGATRIADFTSGQVMVATNENPVVPNGARAVALPWWAYSAYAGGDYMRLTVNAIKWASRQPDPVLKTMPMELSPYKITLLDDDPTTTTPEDPVPVSVEVRDDDEGKFIVYRQDELSYNDFNNVGNCYYASPTNYRWPTGWTVNPSNGWRCELNSYYTSRAASIIWNYNDPNYGTGSGTSHLYSPSYDTTGYNILRFEVDTDWRGNGAPGPSDGYIRASTDGGATYPILLAEYHHLDPATFAGHLLFDRYDLGGYSNVKFRFTYVSNDDYGWFNDNIRVTGFLADTIDGLGTASGTAWVANVAPTIIGGFDTAARDEAVGLDFEGFSISDPALDAPTEWFAYSWDMGDGTPTQWTYKGTMSPPKFDVFVIHSLDSFGCSTYCNQFRSMLLGLKDVASVDTFNFFNPPSAPSLATMMNYDVIIVTFNWGWNNYDPWDLAKRLTGDRIASYLEAGRGGVVTAFGVFGIHPSYPQIWDLMGRFIDWDYGPYERAAMVNAASTLGPIFEPGHDIMAGISSGSVTFPYWHNGDNALTVGGLGIAAGTNGVNLADTADGGRAIGAKVLSNGARAAHVGGITALAGLGGDMDKLMYNAIGWAAGGIPNPNLASFNYVFGDNGVYNVELNVIDDDMGYVWDPVNNVPVEVIPGIPYAQRTMTVTVDNVDPTIATDSFEAFIATEVCVRVSGTEGNSVSVEVFEDGVLVSSVTTVRLVGDPNPPDEKCGLFKIDVLEGHSYESTLSYSAPSGGSNPSWLIFNPWRDPVTPGHGTVTWKYDFDTDGQVIPQSLSTLKRGLLDAGHGAQIDFAADAYDPGTDDLAFLWVWGAVTNTASEIPNDATMVYQINIHHNNGMPTSDGVLADPQHLGFSEPFFDRAANTVLSPLGTTHYRSHDTAAHAFDMEQSMYYVTLIVLDDDNGRGYASPFQTDGIDMDFIFLDLS
jgi:hypothetical protein